MCSIISTSAFLLITPALPEISTLSLHDALPISARHRDGPDACVRADGPVAQPSGLRADHGTAHRHGVGDRLRGRPADHPRSEEHTSELQSLTNLVCRLLLEKKKKLIII